MPVETVEPAPVGPEQIAAVTAQSKADQIAAALADPTFVRYLMIRNGMTDADIEAAAAAKLGLTLESP